MNQEKEEQKKGMKQTPSMSLVVEKRKKAINERLENS
jgi:hypothetical protein